MKNKLSDFQNQCDIYIYSFICHINCGWIIVDDNSLIVKKFFKIVLQYKKVLFILSYIIQNHMIHNVGQKYMLI